MGKSICKALHRFYKLDFDDKAGLIPIDFAYAGKTIDIQVVKPKMQIKKSQLKSKLKAKLRMMLAQEQSSSQANTEVF